MSSKQSTEPVPVGTLLLIGKLSGQDDLALKTTEASARMNVILKCFIKLTGVRKPVIEVITSTGSADPVAFYWQITKNLEKIGNCTVNHIHAFLKQDHCPDDLLTRISRADGIFFADGDQLKICRTYARSQLFSLIRHRYMNERLVVAGLNAGAMALSTLLIYYDSPAYDDALSGLKVTTGLKLLGNVCIDTRFPWRGRIERMATVLADNPKAIGLSIHKDTALIIKSGTEATTVGYGAVVITNTGKRNAHEPAFKKYLQVLLLLDGETYSFRQFA